MSRVIVLTPQVTGADGVSAVSRQVIRALAAQLGRGVQALDVWTLHDADVPEENVAPGLRYRALGGRRLAYAALAVQEDPVDAGTLVLVLHAHLLPVVLPLGRRGARIVPFLLGIEAWTPLGTLQRLALRRSWRITAISHHTAARFRAANPQFADSPIHVCHPGVPDDFPETSHADRSGRAGVPDAPYALIVGRMSGSERYKGHDELLDAWPHVTAAVPQACLVVAGGGDDEARLRAKSRALGLDGAVVFEGHVSAARLAALYDGAAFFVMPSRDEGFGLVYLEAMRAGKACIAAAGAAEEIIEDGVSGLIVDSRDGEALARTAIRLFSDTQLRDAFGRAAARRVGERFVPTCFAARLFEVLDLPPVATGDVSRAAC